MSSDNNCIIVSKHSSERKSHISHFKSKAIPQKIKNGTALWPSDSASENRSEENQNTDLKEYMNLIAALFTIAKIWKPSKCPPVDE